MLLGILLLFVIGRTRRWHERWMEQRLLAELIRQLRVLIPLGGGRPFPRTSTHLGVYGNLSQTWMYWHMRAIARATGIPNARVTHDYVLNCLSYIDRIVGGPDEGQFRFHKDTGTRSEHIAHRLHNTSTWLFGLTLFGIALHLVMELLGSAALPMGMKFEIPESWPVTAADTWRSTGASAASRFCARHHRANASSSVLPGSSVTGIIAAQQRARAARDDGIEPLAGNPGFPGRSTATRAGDFPSPAMMSYSPGRRQEQHAARDRDFDRASRIEFRKPQRRAAHGAARSSSRHRRA